MWFLDLLGGSQILFWIIFTWLWRQQPNRNSYLHIIVIKLCTYLFCQPLPFYTVLQRLPLLQCFTPSVIASSSPSLYKRGTICFRLYLNCLFLFHLHTCVCSLSLSFPHFPTVVSSALRDWRPRWLSMSRKIRVIKRFFTPYFCVKPGTTVNYSYQL